MNREELLGKFFALAISGGLLGIVISLTINIGSAEGDVLVISKRYFITQLIGSALNGIVCMGGTIVYDIESWGLRRVTAIHFGLAMCSFITSDIVLGWFPLKYTPLVIVIFVAAYFIIWFFEYTLWRREIQRINLDLQQMIKRDGEADAE